VTEAVLHLDFIELAPQTSAADRETIFETAAALGAVDFVQAVGVIESQDSAADLLFYFLLPDFAALEPFGTDPSYARFLQGSVAPHLHSFAGADLRLEAAFPAAAEVASCLALAAGGQTYDWEVRSALEQWAEGWPAEARTLGLAAGDRGRYRGAAIAMGEPAGMPSLPDVSALQVRQVRGRLRRLT
jgi:hypothetical protein